MKSIYIAIQDAVSHRWTPVARVDREEESYRLRYTKGARSVDGFRGFVRMEQLEREFTSYELFPILKNRVLSRSRPEFSAYAHWLGSGQRELDVFDELARTGGLRGTDSLELIPLPEKTDDGKYQVYFFVHGIRHVAPEVKSLLSKIKEGDRLYVAADLQNNYDQYALFLRTVDPIALVGYVPRYYSRDFFSLLRCDPKAVEVEVEQVNSSAPAPFRLLCKMAAPWPNGFNACSGEFYELISPAH
ncbi:HIRAN domain-containing protein [Xanthomonas oryzae]|nr:HIRAN domain-containing protein [Xanthomonas oryzae]BAE70763.1 conserved hypothetical protein [Xanthomonas oryzae pv. oryzae MAFF 311018]MDI9070828.1 HIRAN domain-containing protein [Xanthomonas oryzae pv. oryzae]QGN63931.1 hypothetical protein GKO49_15210 [Xanthomonas oryzae pv. oryzae]QUW76688.1 HIRAN domain-containing protein [Xanthomonas oryzae]UAD91528.1 HIRAN domain-containing protein [Xanthomonas oryzae pv. oryzae]